MCLALHLGGQWIEGSVEYAKSIYAAPYPESPLYPTFNGYSFVSRDGEVCGLCVGMKVCLLSVGSQVRKGGSDASGRIGPRVCVGICCW